MQVVGVAGRHKSGKTTLCHTIAALVVDDGYGIPAVHSFSSTQNDPCGVIGMLRKLEIEQSRERSQIEAENPRVERIVLIDNVWHPQHIQLLNKWDAVLIYLDSGPRIKSAWKERERMVRDYSRGALPETIFKWHLTNYHERDAFIRDIETQYRHWIGGTIWEDEI
jgi:hypothetical protein